MSKSAADVLYVTRKFPPSVGGMENLALEFDTVLRASSSEQRVALGASQRNLIWFLPFAALRTAISVYIARVPTVLVGDPVVLLALWPVLVLSRARVIVVVHGLDLTLPNRAYRWCVRRALRRADLVVAISSATKHEAAALGVSAGRIEVILPGLPVPEAEEQSASEARSTVLSLTRCNGNAVLLVTLGRLVKRKGQAWFVSNVLPQLPEQYVYVVAGAGPDRQSISDAASRAGVADRVFLLGAVDEKVREVLLQGADVFVVPNISVSGDMEGFGLVAAEAALRGTPVVAARTEGLVDAVVDGETGTLCESGDAAGFAKAVQHLVEHPAERRSRSEIRDAAVARYGSQRFAGEVRRVLTIDAPANS